MSNILSKQFFFQIFKQSVQQTWESESGLVREIPRLGRTEFKLIFNFLFIFQELILSFPGQVSREKSRSKQLAVEQWKIFRFITASPPNYIRVEILFQSSSSSCSNCDIILSKCSQCSFITRDPRSEEVLQPEHQQQCFRVRQGKFLDWEIFLLPRWFLYWTLETYNFSSEQSWLRVIRESRSWLSPLTGEIQWRRYSGMF